MDSSTVTGNSPLPGDVPVRAAARNSDLDAGLKYLQTYIEDYEAIPWAAVRYGRCRTPPAFFSMHIPRFPLFFWHQSPPKRQATPRYKQAAPHSISTPQA